MGGSARRFVIVLASDVARFRFRSFRAVFSRRMRLDMVGRRVLDLARSIADFGRGK